jgi:hypothetical protein
MADLKTDYQDDVLDASENTARVYDLVDSNGNVVLAGVHLEDKTVYTTEGDDYGAADINEQNEKINGLNADLSDISNNVDNMLINTLGSSVNLTTAYSASSPFTVPHDGYVNVYRGQFTIYGSDMTNGVGVFNPTGAGNEICSATFVRKGMKIVVTKGTPTYTPLI